MCLKIDPKKSRNFQSKKVIIISIQDDPAELGIQQIRLKMQETTAITRVTYDARSLFYSSMCFTIRAYPWNVLLVDLLLLTNFQDSKPYILPMTSG